MHEVSVLYGSRIIAHLASILPLLLPLPKNVADPEDHDLLPGKIEITVPSVSEKVSHLLLFRVVEPVFAHF